MHLGVFRTGRRDVPAVHPFFDYFTGPDGSGIGISCGRTVEVAVGNTTAGGITGCSCIITGTMGVASIIGVTGAIIVVPPFGGSMPGAPIAGAAITPPGVAQPVVQLPTPVAQFPWPPQTFPWQG